MAQRWGLWGGLAVFVLLLALPAPASMPLPAWRTTAIVILMATCPPSSVEAIAARVLGTGRHFVDAPVSGGTVGAAGATLTIMAAAPAETFEAAKPVLDALGDKLFQVGERPGQAAMVKTVNQLLCGVHIAVVAEAFSLAAKVGVDQRIMLEILSGSAASSWMLNDRGPRMLQADPEVSSAVDIFVKDLGIVLEAGRDTRAALPASRVRRVIPHFRVLPVVTVFLPMFAFCKLWPWCNGTLT